MTFTYGHAQVMYVEGAWRIFVRTPIGIPVELADEYFTTMEAAERQAREYGLILVSMEQWRRDNERVGTRWMP